MELAADTSTAIRPPSADIVRTLSSINVRTTLPEDRMALSASNLRANVYRLLDQVLETGKPLEIERNGKTLVILPKEKETIWDRLPRREGFIVGDPDELIHMDWSSEWNPDPP
jgi:Antitoxin Phd_YefM, type II toxin-antitoxin system